jgi:arsenate reductase
MRFDVHATGRCCDRRAIRLLCAGPERSSNESVCKAFRLLFVTNVLFLCTGNTARSILAEATFNHLAPPGWRAESAGSHPKGAVHPRALALLAREGIPTQGLTSKSWETLPVVPDVVITVCASAAAEACPAYLGDALRSHWGVDDPASATGTDAEIAAQFDDAYRIIRKRVAALVALPLSDLQHDRTRLEAELGRIGNLS